MKSNTAYAISAEVDRDSAKNPDWPTDPVRAARIVCLHAGDIEGAAISTHYSGKNRDEIRKAALRTAATCVRLLEAL